MLQELDIQNLAIIDQLKVNFDSGMTVLTGETGAGKSIIMDAVSLLTGSRGSKQYLRTGSDKLTLQGLFTFPLKHQVYSLLDQLGIDHEDGNIIVQREIYLNGRNLCRINGILVNTTTLKSVGSLMVDIEGQHDHQSLLNPEHHLPLLDQFIGREIADLKNQYQKAYDHYRQLKQRNDEKNNNQQLWAQRLDMLTFQVDEIENAHLKPNEEVELNHEREQIKNHQIIADSLNESRNDINGNETISPLDMIGDAMSKMQSIEQLGDAFKTISDNVRDAYYMLQDAANDISSQLDVQGYDEKRLAEIEERLSLIFTLKRKYGNSVSAVLAYYQKVATELAEMQDAQISDDDLQKQLAASEQLLLSLSQQMSQIRHQAAKRLVTLIHHQLAALYMNKTRFEVRFTPLEAGQFNRFGNENVEFYLQSNPGEGFNPLAKIASGGELSRIMLALKTIFTELQGVGTIIFDEVDTGVSGRVAQAIAEKISAIGQGTQVLCITHLAQVAAIANHHDFVSKVIHDGRTETKLTKLNHQQQIQEIARMISGSEITDLTLEHASEMLRLAHAKH